MRTERKKESERERERELRISVTLCFHHPLHGRCIESHYLLKFSNHLIISEREEDDILLSLSHNEESKTSSDVVKGT